MRQNHCHTSAQDKLLNKKKSGALFGCVQCDVKVPERLREKFTNLAPFFKTTTVCRQDICPFKQEYAERERKMSQAWRVFFSSVELTNDTIKTRLLLINLELRIVCTRFIASFVYTPVNCLHNLVQSTVNARCQEDENPNSSVVAESKKLLGKSWNGYQNID